jgi:hypothetical protein
MPAPPTLVLPDEARLPPVVTGCEDGNSDKTRSAPGDRVRSENPYLIGPRTERPQVIDAGLQRAARIGRRHGTTPRVNLELTVRLGCSWSFARHS